MMSTCVCFMAGRDACRTNAIKGKNANETHLNAIRFGIDYIGGTGNFIAFSRNNIDCHFGLVVQLDNSTAFVGG